MRIKLGIKALSIVSSMVLSLVVIAGCNEEPTTPATTPSTPAVKTPPGDTAKPPAPAPTAPKDDMKKTP